MDEIPKEANQGLRKTQLGYRKLRPVFLNELLYADDLLVFETEKKALQERLDKWSMRKYGLKINIEKTEIMAIANKKEGVNIQVKGEETKISRNIHKNGWKTRGRDNEQDTKNRMALQNAI